jgi:hypothetical protein
MQTDKSDGVRSESDEDAEPLEQYGALVSAEYYNASPIIGVVRPGTDG